MNLWFGILIIFLGIPCIPIAYFIFSKILEFIMFVVVTGASKQYDALRKLGKKKFTRSKINIRLLTSLFKKILLMAIIIGYLFVIVWAFTGSWIIAGAGLGLTAIGSLAVGVIYGKSDMIQGAIYFYASQVLDEGDYARFEKQAWEEKLLEVKSMSCLVFLTKHGSHHIISMSTFANKEYWVLPESHDRHLIIPVFPNSDLDLLDGIFLTALKEERNEMKQENTNLMYGIDPDPDYEPVIWTEVDHVHGLIKRHFMFRVNDIKAGWELDSVVTEKIIKMMSNAGMTIGTPTGIWRDEPMTIMKDDYTMNEINTKNPTWDMYNDNEEKKTSVTSKTKEWLDKKKESAKEVLNRKRRDKEIRTDGFEPIDDSTEEDVSKSDTQEDENNGID